eukprot:m.1645257 g.1645257  ORF g.1645257 m.1645257 type:complete len:53 (-) comp66330_c0_seq1:15-173(-)
MCVCVRACQAGGCVCGVCAQSAFVCDVRAVLPSVNDCTRVSIFLWKVLGIVR